MNTKYPIIGTIYRHYKSTNQEPRLYKITGIAKHSETDELLVIYEPLYANVWMIQSQANFSARPLAMFMDQIEIDKKFVLDLSLSVMQKC